MTSASADTRTTHGLIVYGVVPAAAVPPEVPGLDESPLETVTYGRVAAVVGRVLLERPPVRKADLASYHAVLEALAAAGPVAPVRFGSILLDADQVVAELLAPQEEMLADLLDALRNRAEFTVRAQYVEEVVLADVVAGDPTIRDLNERTRGVPEEASWAERVRLGELVAHAVEEIRQADAEFLMDLLEPYAVEYRIRGGTGLDHLLDVALLVDDDRRAELEQALEDYAAAAHERVRVSLVGPLPPYDFVGGG